MEAGAGGDPTLASDAERDAVVDRLAAACAEGRITLGEFGERSTVAVAARTRGDLAPLVGDLPAADRPRPDPARAQPHQADASRDGGPTTAGVPATDHATERHFSVLGLVSRRGRWRVRPHTLVTTLIGGVELDLSQAVVSDYDVTLRVVSIIGRVEVIVPKGVRVEVTASSPIGGRDINLDELAPDRPVIWLSAFSFVGGVEVKSR